MSIVPQHPARADRKGLFAALGGIVLLGFGFLASTVCCWAPAIVIGLGFGSVFIPVIGMMHGARWALIAAGSLLAVGGLAWWLFRMRHRTTCDC